MRNPRSLKSELRVAPELELETRHAPIVISDDLLATCVHCGFCVPECPTWDLLREENDSPRGRLYLMRAETDGRVDPAGAFALHLGRCLGCRACESVCPAGVPYGHLLEKARTRIPVRSGTRRLQGWLLSLLTRQRLMTWTYGLGRILRDTGVATFLGIVLPGRAGSVFRLLAASRPRLRVRVGQAEAQTGVSEAADDTYSLLQGCVMGGLFDHVHEATRRALATAGYLERPAPEQGCCGALHAHAGRMGEARALARLNIEAFEGDPEAWIVSDSAGCGAAIRDYPVWLERDDAWRDRATAVAARARDVTELLAGATLPSGRPVPGRAAYDAPCHLHHAQGVREEPVDVLGAIEGLEVERLPSSERCCGGAGLYNLAQPELAAGVLAPKVEEIGRGGYDWVVSGNPGCVMFIGAGLTRAGVRTPVVHPVELLDLAWHAAPEG